MEQKTRSIKASTEGDFLTRKMPFYMIPDKIFGDFILKIFSLIKF